MTMPMSIEEASNNDDSSSRPSSPSPVHQRRLTITRNTIMCFILLGVPLLMVGWQDMQRMGDSSENKAWNKIGGGVDIAEASNELSDVAQTTAVTTSSDSPNNNNNSTSASSRPKRPKMVWLMSFPNSGTSYTMRMVASVSNRAIATNYGPEFTSPPHPNIPVYPVEDEEVGIVSNGPFWRGPDEDKELPDKYILTKTHCGGRCVRCGPSKYVLSPGQFLHACTEGSGFLPTTNSNGNTSNTCNNKSCKWKVTHYPPPPRNPHIGKLIHLIRNPFDNIVSRFHLARKSWKKRLEDDSEALEEWQEQHPDTADGFSAWCNELDEKWGSPLDQQHNPDLPSLDHLSCLGEWFKYVQWHALALAVQQQSKPRVPSLTIYYEDYARDWNGTSQTILDFMELQRDPSSEEWGFVARPPYDDYFTKEQQREAKALVKKLASDDVWGLLKRYF